MMLNLMEKNLKNVQRLDQMIKVTLILEIPFSFVIKLDRLLMFRLNNKNFSNPFVFILAGVVVDALSAFMKPDESEIPPIK